MRATGIVVVLGLSLLCVPQAEAVKLIIKTKPRIIEAPPHPTIVLRSDRIDALDPTDVAGKRHFAFTVTTLDDYWTAVTIDAKPGDTFIDNHNFGYLDRYHVQSSVPQVNRDIVDVTSNDYEGRRYWSVKWMGADLRAWTRVDWAYTPEDLENGRYGSIHESVLSDATWDTTTDIDRVFVRVMTFRMNGKTEVTRMWLTRDGDDVTTHDGVGTAPEPPAAARCIVDAPRPVAVDPTFRVNVSETPRFHVITEDGRVLATRLAPRQTYDDRWTLAVSAPEGTTFRVERFPIPPGCPHTRLLRATHDRSHDEAPTVLGQSHRSPITVCLELADPDTWDSFDVTSRDEATGAPLAFTPNSFPSESADELSVPAESYYATPRIFVTITPRWGASHGAAWTGWLTKDNTTATTIVESSTRTQPPQIVIAAPVAPASHAAVSVTRQRGDFPVRPVLVVILLLALVPMRPTIRVY